MKRFLFSAALLFLLTPAACSDDDGSSAPDASTLKQYGQACTDGKECATGKCEAKICTVTCTKPSDCPSVGSKQHHCGEVTAGKLTCYPQTWDNTKMGADCSKTGTCEADHKCTGQAGDADRYCAGKCTADTDCPPTHRCVATRTGKAAAETTKYCLKRQFCHPCAGDWQCSGADAKCIKDTLGNGFCSETCTPKASDAGVSADMTPGGTCPNYATCVKDSTGSYCKHKAGYCTKGFKSEGGNCAPCITHGWVGTGTSSDPVATVAEVGQCKGTSFCVIYDRYYGDSACFQTCTDTASCGDTKLKCLKLEASVGTSICRPATTAGCGW